MVLPATAVVPVPTTTSVVCSVVGPADTALPPPPAAPPQPLISSPNAIVVAASKSFILLSEIVVSVADSMTLEWGLRVPLTVPPVFRYRKHCVETLLMVQN
jgi:hypothetical protein